MIPEIIETDRVRLRPFQTSDLADLVAGCNDPLVQRWLPRLPQPYTMSDARWWLAEGAAATRAAGGAAYAIADPGTDRLLGGIGLDRVVPARKQAELGYWVAPWGRGRGVASAAAAALVEQAWRSGFARLELLTHPENAVSQRVALATGFRSEGMRRGVLAGPEGSRCDLLVWSRLSDDPPGPTPRLLPDLPDGRLTDGVVTLRPLTGADVDFIHALHSLPDVVATSVPPVAPTRAKTESRCLRAPSRWLLGERADLVILDAATGTPAGEIVLFYQQPQLGQGLIGYSMHPDWRGRGYPGRAARLLARWAFTQAGLSRLEAGTLPENIRSQRVLRKAGFRQEGRQRGRLPDATGQWVDNVAFSLLPTDLDQPVEPDQPGR